MSTPHTAKSSLLRIENLTPQSAHRIIQQALKLKSGQSTPQVSFAKRLVAALVFFEPSTRTRFSFEVACHRMGVHPTAFLADSTTSMAKGETLHETMNTLIAMRPDLVVVRAPAHAQLEKILAETSIPVLNAGTGVEEHPTQALLDAMTIIERKGRIESERILFVGDVSHSRVANSGIQLFKRLGAEVACSSPVDMKPQSKLWVDARHFENLKDGLQWATVCIGLRIQKERHGRSMGQEELQSYIRQFRLDKKNISDLSADALIMHPGPFVPEEDFSEELLQDSRVALHDQVTNGVYVRMATIGDLLGIPCT